MDKAESHAHQRDARLDEIPGLNNITDKDRAEELCEPAGHHYTRM